MFEKIRIPILLVIPALAAAFAAGPVLISDRDKLLSTAAAVSRLESERELHSLRLQALELELRSFRAQAGDSLRRIERKLGTSQ